ncbi:MAG: hypothetical protein KIT81_12000 [Alphaproteobacteria bacterium]|nr:hypothetical protein [Alphaproteobacteria bacterium]
MKSIRKRMWGTFVKRAPKTRFFDRIISTLLFYKAHGRMPRIGGGLNDALHYLKVGDEILRPQRAFVSDKEFVKHYIRAKVGEEFNVPTIAVLRSLDEALSYQYPADCAIKPTHLSGHLILRRNGAPIDPAKIRFWFRKNYYIRGREANYRYLEPKIIVEPLIFGSEPPNDYKFFCVEGKVRGVMVDLDSFTDHVRSFYSPDWEKLPFGIRFPISRDVERPANLVEMIAVAEKLAADFSFVRIDLYSNGRRIYCGEITNCQGNALRPIFPAEHDSLFSRMLFGEAGFQLSLFDRARARPDLTLPQSELADTR